MISQAHALNYEKKKNMRLVSKALLPRASSHGTVKEDTWRCAYFPVLITTASCASRLYTAATEASRATAALARACYRASSRRPLRELASEMAARASDNSWCHGPPRAPDASQIRQGTCFQVCACVRACVRAWVC